MGVAKQTAVRRSGLGYGRKTSGYFLISECSNYDGEVMGVAYILGLGILIP